MTKGLICVPICASTLDLLAEKLTAVRGSADVVEIRFDCLDPNLWDLVPRVIADANFDLPVLATVRTLSQGGSADISASERLQSLKNFALTYWAIDVESLPLTSGRAIAVASHHDTAGSRAEPEESFDRLSRIAHVVKVAVTADEATDAIAVWRLLERSRRYGKQVIPIAMGDGGKWVRVLGLAHGALLTFASLDNDSGTAPGQISVKEMRDLYRAQELTQETKVFGVIGDPVSQSLSTYMHNPAFVAAGVDGVFIPLQVKSIEAFMTRMVRKETREVDLNFGGFSVTMPHKRSIMQFLDRLDPAAERIGAVNTIEFVDGQLIGHNTDAHGFIKPLKERLGDLRNARIAVCGAGGAARACVYALIEDGAEVDVFARDTSKAEAFASEFGTGSGGLGSLDKQLSAGNTAYDVLVDSTPMGMTGPLEDQSLVSADALRGVKFVYDLVTKSSDTPILREAKAAGVPGIGGTEMLIAQGAKQFEFWTKRAPPVDVMRQAVVERFAELNR